MKWSTFRGEDHFVATPFDAYYTWLGIPPEEQPPNYYRLLGIKVFEANRDVIQHAADRQMAHLKNFNNSQNAAHAQRLLNELSLAAGILMNAEKRQAYDQQLKVPATSAATSHRPPPFSQREGATVAIDLPRFSVPDPLTTPLSVLVTDSLPAPRRRKSSARAGGPPPWIGLAVVGTLLLVVVVMGLALVFGGSEGEPPANADAPVRDDRG
jgi:hypothetical protein